MKLFTIFLLVREWARQRVSDTFVGPHTHMRIHQTQREVLHPSPSSKKLRNRKIIRGWAKGDITDFNISMKFEYVRSYLVSTVDSNVK